MKRAHTALPTAVFLAASAAAQAAQDPESTVVWSSKISEQLLAGSITGLATLEAPSDTPTVFDTFRLTITLRGNEAVDAQEIDLRNAVPLEWFGESETLVTVLESDPPVTTLSTTFEPLRSGDVDFNLSLTVPSAFGPIEISTPTASVFVGAVAQSRPESADTAPAVARPHYDATPPLPLLMIVAITAGGLVLLMLCALAIVTLARRVSNAESGPRVVVDSRPPSRVALDELDALLARKHIEREEYEPFFDGASGILRRYIERAADLHAPRLTTDEFLREARRSDRFSSTETHELSSFLGTADSLKFARGSATHDTAKAAVGTIRRFVSTQRSGSSSQDGAE